MSRRDTRSAPAASQRRMTFADHFSTVAAQYAAYRPHYPPALVDVLATDRARRDSVGRRLRQWPALDRSRRAFARVIATDPPQTQIRRPWRTRRRVSLLSRRSQRSSRASVALVVAAQAAHWFDWPPFTAEAGARRPSRRSRRAGRYGTASSTVAQRAVVALLPRRRGAPGRRSASHIENGYRDLVLPWPAEPAARDEPLQWTRDELLGYLSTWSATNRYARRTAPRRSTSWCATWPQARRRASPRALAAGHQARAPLRSAQTPVPAPSGLRRVRPRI